MSSRRRLSSIPVVLVCALVTVVALGLFSYRSVAEARQAAQYDLLIRNARVLDGSGNPWFIADVAVKEGRIAAIGPLGSAAAARTIDATGKFLAPGFIDIHSHSDRGLGDLNLRYNINMVGQGIMLSVVNQDGRSAWPIRDQKARYEKQGVGSNVALMVGHGAVRTRVMGARANQVATDADITAMQGLVEEGMKDGAYGLSTGLEYVPGRFSEPREVIEITRPVKKFGGFYISHKRSEGRDPMWHVASDPTPYVDLLDAVKETIAIGRETGVPVVCSRRPLRVREWRHGRGRWEVHEDAAGESAVAGQRDRRSSISISMSGSIVRAVSASRSFRATSSCSSAACRRIKSSRIRAISADGRSLLVHTSELGLLARSGSWSDSRPATPAM